VVLIKTRFKLDPEKMKAQTYVLKVHPSVYIEAMRMVVLVTSTTLIHEDVDFQDVRTMMMKEE
jgi:hypothetical protein